MDMKNIFHTFAWGTLLVLAGCVTPSYTYTTVEPPPPPPPTVVAPVTYSSGPSYVVPSYGPTWSTYEYRSYMPPIPPPGVHGHHDHHHHKDRHGHHEMHQRHHSPPPTMVRSNRGPSPSKTSRPVRTINIGRPKSGPPPRGTKPPSGGYPGKSGRKHK